MPKHLLEDMIKHNRGEFTETKEMETKVSPTGLPSGIAPRVSQPREVREVGDIRTNSIKKRHRYMLWFVAFVSIVFCFFALTFLFSKAAITVNPKIKDVVLNENLSANKDSNTDGLSFDLVVISGEENKSIPAIGEKDVSDKATGKVVIYNAFSSSSQPLNIDTRLEGSNGKIYKTQIKSIVPGMTKDGTLGSVEVGIYGVEAGAEYNSVPLDFKIFGFKGTPKYSKFYARSKGQITGGFKGKVPNVSDVDKTSAIADIKATLKEKLLQKATDQIPSGFILFKDAVFLSTDNANSEPNVSSVLNKDNSMTLTVKGTLYGLLFNEQKLTKKIAESNIDKYDGSPVYIPNIKDLTFSLSNKDNISFADVKSIDFNLSGTTKIIWKLDADKFTTDLLGKSKNDFNKILSQYGNIDSAVLKLSPPWMISIPGKVKDVKVIVNYPK